MAKKRKKPADKKPRGYTFPSRPWLIPYTREFPGAQPYSLAIKRLAVPMQDAIVHAVELLKPGDHLKRLEDITDEDRCQRGPNGKPLARVTPGVPYLTLAEWEARHAVET